MGWLKIVGKMVAGKDSKEQVSAAMELSEEYKNKYDIAKEDAKEATEENEKLKGELGKLNSGPNLEDYLPVDSTTLDESLVNMYRDRLIRKSADEYQSSVNESVAMMDDDGESEYEKLYNTLRALVGIESAKVKYNMDEEDADLKADKLAERLAKERSDDLKDAIMRYNSDLDEINLAKKSEDKLKEEEDEITPEKKKSFFDSILGPLGGLLSGGLFKKLVIKKLGGKLLGKGGKMLFKGVKGIGKILWKPVKAAWETTSNLFKKIGTKFKNAKPVKSLKEYLGNAWNSIKEKGAKMAETVKDKGAKFLGGLKDKFAKSPAGKLANKATKKIGSAIKGAKNLITKSTSSMGNIFKKVGNKLGKRAAAKIGGKAAGKTLGKMIPGVGLVMGLYDLGKASYNMYKAHKSGDPEAMKAAKMEMAGGALSALSGAASVIPGVGTVASGLIGAAGTGLTVAADVKRDLHNEELEAQKVVDVTPSVTEVLEPESITASSSSTSSSSASPSDEGKGAGEDTKSDDESSSSNSSTLLSHSVNNTINNISNDNSVVLIENRNFRISNI